MAIVLESRLPQIETRVNENGEEEVIKAGLVREFTHGNRRQRRRQGMKYAMLSARFSPDGLFLATASSDKTVRVFHSQTGKELAMIEHNDWVRCAIFSPDGARLCTCCDDRSARVWRWEAREVQHEFKHRLPVVFADYNIFGDKLLTVSKNQDLQVHDLVEYEGTFKLQHEDQVFSAVFNPDGSKIASASGWDHGHAIVWDVELREELFRIKHYAWVTSVHWSPGGNMLLTTCRDKFVRIWNLTDLGLSDMTLNDPEVETVPYDERKEALQFELSNYPDCAGFSRDGRRICVACNDGCARIFELEEGWELICFQEDLAICGITYAPDARRICTASTDGTARVYGGLHILSKAMMGTADARTKKRATITGGQNVFDPPPPSDDEEEGPADGRPTSKAKSASSARRSESSAMRSVSSAMSGDFESRRKTGI